MTGNLIQFSLPGMAKPGKRKVTSTEFRDAVCARTKEARESVGLSIPEMARKLSEQVGVDVPADTYRKYESDSFLRHDLIVAFCNITRTHPFALFDRSPFAPGKHQPFRRKIA